jgi:hypothetical protein
MHKKSTYLTLIYCFMFLFAAASFAALFFQYKWQMQKMQNWYDETDVLSWARHAASLQALVDYQAGTRRLLEALESDDSDTRGDKIRQDGDFEIISFIIFPKLGPLQVKGSYKYIDEYNAKMKLFHDNPDEVNVDHWAGHTFQKQSN